MCEVGPLEMCTVWMPTSIRKQITYERVILVMAIALIVIGSLMAEGIISTKSLGRLALEDYPLGSPASIRFMIGLGSLVTAIILWEKCIPYVKQCISYCSTR